MADALRQAQTVPGNRPGRLVHGRRSDEKINAYQQPFLIELQKVLAEMESPANAGLSD